VSQFDLQDFDSSLVKLGNGKIATAQIPFTSYGVPSAGSGSAFGETKTAEYLPKSAWAFPYNISSINYVPTTENGGSVSHSNAFAVLSTGTNAAGSAELTTRLPMRYYPGIGGILRFTAIFTPGVADSRQIIGYGNHSDGLFFGFIGEQFGILRIDNGSETFIPTSEWDDPAGIVARFDPTKLNVFQIQFQWLGGGELRYFMEDPDYGIFVLVHREKYANRNTSVSLRNPSLPIRAQVTNSGNTSDIVLKSPSASVGLEGTDESRALRALGAIDNSVDISADTETPLLSLRAPLTYEGLENRLSIYGYRFSFAVYGTSNLIGVFRVRVNATLTGASWVQAVPGGSPAEYDISATAVSGGELILSDTVIGPGSDAINLRDLDARLVPGESITLTCIADKQATIAGSHTWDAEV
jgi:hypothetical protein